MLIDNKRLESEIKKINIQDFSAIFSRWDNDIRNERKIQADFLNDIFYDILGYEKNTDRPEYNLDKEQMTDKNKKPVDGVLGFFNQKEKKIKVIIELKDKKTNNLDAVENQAFGYLRDFSDVDWVITSNTVHLRLYSKKYMSTKYQEWKFSELSTDKNKQKEFYFVLNKNNLIGLNENSKSLVYKNVEERHLQQEEIRDKFYAKYAESRKDLFKDIATQVPLNDAIVLVQKLLDRLIFIKFCEDNNEMLKQTFDSVMAARKIGLPYWDSLKLLFNAVDKGNPPYIHRFNGGLFKQDDALDNLKMNNQKLEEFVKFLQHYNFKNDLSVHILGHIFEKSITDIEKLKNHTNNSKKNKDGVFYTPEYLTRFIIEETIGKWIVKTKENIGINKYKPNKELYKLYAKKLSQLKIIDPSCGSGAFLVEVFNFLEKEWLELSNILYNLGDIDSDGLFNYTAFYKSILQNNIFGVDLNQESVQITKLSLWIKTANKDDTLASLDDNIKCGNSIIHHKNIDEKAFCWHTEFKDIFASGGFDIVVGNPPWGADIDKYSQYFAENYPNSTKSYKDTYKIFIEKAISIAKCSVGFVVPNTFLYQPRYVDIKEMIDKYDNKIVNLGEKIFKDVNLPCCVLILDKKSETVESKIADLRFVDRKQIEVEIFDKNLDFKPFAQKDVVQNDNIKKLEEIVIFKDCGMQYQRKNVGKANKWDGDMTERMIYDGEKQNQNDIMYFKGRDMNRYFIAEKTDKFLRYNFKELLQTGESASFNQQIYDIKKILIRQTASQIIATQDDIGIVFDRTIIAIINNNTNIDNWYLLAILNSKYYKYLYRQIVMEVGKVHPQVKLAYLKDLPFCVIDKKEQEPFVKNAKQMIILNKQFQTKSDEFIDYCCEQFKHFAKNKIVKISAKWFLSDFNQFVTDLAKQKIIIPSNIEFEFKKLFDKEKEYCQELNNIIETTDKYIDDMVYKIYNLAVEEINLIENNEKN